MRSRDLLICLSASISSSSCAAFVLLPSHQPRTRWQLNGLSPGRYSTRIYSEEPENSISDYTLGLHGGKYQFDSAGMNYEGQQFAQTGYGSSSEEEQKQEDFSNEPLPKWALRLQRQLPPESCPVLEVASNGGTAEVEFSNEERSWERFYAMIIPEGGPSKEQASGGALCYTVEPSVGLLAPRGGSGAYTHMAQVVVKNEQLPGGSSSDCWLVVGTEAETWHYKLQ
jgi:hypothetical protein